MEIIYSLVIMLLLGTVVYLLWKNRCLKRDIYDFTEKLDYGLQKLLNEQKLTKEVYGQDDLWNMIHEKLCRISDLYTLKNLELQKEKEYLKELVSDLSHQTKTPLANMKLYQELLCDEMHASERTEYLTNMSRQIDKLDFLLQSMVKMSRLETGTIKIQKSKHLIADTLALAIEAVVPYADRKNISIHVTYDETLLLTHDKKWTTEAIFNILDNAVKYTEENGSISILIKQEEIFTKISIADTGKGIPIERQGAIFNRFYREPEVHGTQGVGIGLYLARKIISMQYGYIKVESEPGKGSIFQIYLPN